MSAELRRKLAKEIIDNSKKRSGTYDIGALFSEGQVTMSRKNLEAVVTNYFNKSGIVPKALTADTIDLKPEHLNWVTFGEALKKQVSGKGQNAKFWKLDGPSKLTTNELTFYYKRPQRSVKTVYAKSLEETFNEMLKKEVKNLIKTKKFIDYSHGTSLPGEFEQNKAKGQTTDPSMRGSQGFKSPGAVGTKAQKDIENAIYSVLKGGAEKIVGNVVLYKNLTKVVQAKYNDIFEVNLDVDSRTTKNSDGSSAKFEGELVFSDSKLNPGGPDRKVRREMKKWLEQEWSAELGEYLKKLMKLDITKGQKLWADSPGPVDRAMILQQGLLAEGLITAMGKLDKRSKRVSKDGGLDMRLKVNKEFIKKMNEITKKKIAAHDKLKKAKKMKSSTKSSGGGAVALIKPRRRTKDAAKTAQSPLHLEAMLQALLPQVVASKMGQGGALRYQTGRFADSVKPEAVMVGPQGGVQVDYTYMKFPYQTFEPGFKQGSTQRDPRKIIGESVREIAQSIIGDKFLKVRRV
jgi:hypothetical protein